MICTADNETNLENKKQYPKLQWKLIRKPYAPKSIPVSATINIAHHPSWIHFLDNVSEVRGFQMAS